MSFLSPLAETSQGDRTGGRSGIHLTAPPAPDSSAFHADPSIPTGELLRRARETRAAAAYDISEMLYENVLIREPENVTAMLELAGVYEINGKLEYARGLLTRASIIKPYDEEIIRRSTDLARRLSRSLEAEVDSLLAGKDYESALPRLSILLTLQPESSELHHKRAQCYLQLGEPEAAIVEIDDAIRLDRLPRYFDLRNMAVRMVEEQAIQSLVQRAERAMASGSPTAREEALGYIARVLELDPGHAWALEAFSSLTGKETAGTPPRSRGAANERLTGWTRTVWSAALAAAAVLRSHALILLAALVVLLVLKSPLTWILVRGYSPRHSLAGRLTHYSISEVLALINTHQRTGSLRIATPETRGRIYFADGEVYHCTNGRLTGREALRELLKGARDGHFVFHDSDTSRHQTVDVPLSLILLDLPERRVNITAKESLRRQAKSRSRMKAMLEKKTETEIPS